MLEYISDIGSYDNGYSSTYYSGYTNDAGGFTGDVPPAGGGDGDGGDPPVIQGYSSWEGVEGPFDSVLGVVQDLGRGFIQLKRDKLAARNPGFVPTNMWSNMGSGLVESKPAAKGFDTSLNLPLMAGVALVAYLAFRR